MFDPTARARRARHVRGSATAEAIIALPFFALILFGVVYVGRVTERHTRLSMAMRTCAYRHALAGCGATNGLPEDCQKALATSPPPLDTRGALAAVGESPDILEELGEIPLVGPLFDNVFGHMTTAHVAVERERPLFMGGGTVVERATARLLCNERPSHDGIGEALMELWLP